MEDSMTGTKGIATERVLKLVTVEQFLAQTESTVYGDAFA